MAINPNPTHLPPIGDWINSYDPANDPNAVGIPSLVASIRPTSSTPANGGATSSASIWSQAGAALSDALTNNPFVNPLSAISGAASAAAGAVTTGSASPIGSYITSNLSRYVTIGLALIVIAAGVFSFSHVQEVAGEFGKAAIA